MLQPTSPLRQSVHIDGIFKLRNKFNSDSAVSLSLSKKPIIYKLNKDLKIQHFSENITPLPRQKLSNLYNLNGALYLSSRESNYKINPLSQILLLVTYVRRIS